MKKTLYLVLMSVILIGVFLMQIFAEEGNRENEASTELSEDCYSHIYKNGVCTMCGSSVAELYTHANPENQGVVNAIERAYQLTDVEWTPLADMPGVKKIDGEFTVITFKAGVTYRGIPYSGVIATDTYVGLNVSLESFLTALQNKNSVLYTENLHSTNSKSATYFGTVCSKFAQYILDIPGSYNTNNVANIPGVDTIAMPGKFTVDDIKLGDIVLHTQNHTSVCTDILYDNDGNVAYVEISEAVLPLVRRMLWSPEEFYEYFSGYRLCRYQYIADVPTAPTTTDVNEKYSLMPRFGDKYNYPVSSAKGIVDILESGYSTAVVIRDGEVINRIELGNAKTFTFDRSVPGYVEMYLEKADGTQSGSVYACIVKSSVFVVDSREFARGKLTVTIDGSCGKPLYVQVGSAHAIFCNVEGKDGTVELTFPASKISNRQVRVAYQNEYGIYLSKWVSFTADANPSKDPLLSQGQYWNGYNITPSSPTPVIQENKVGYWSYTMIPVEENTTYYSWGATRLWYLDSNGAGIGTCNVYKDGEIPCQFTTPAGTEYVSIAYSPTLVNQGEERLERLSFDLEDGNDDEEDKDEEEGKKDEENTNPDKDNYLSEGEYWDGYTLTPSSSTPVIKEGKLDYWTYTMVPVEGNTAYYYSVGANRMWFFDANKKPISTYNALKDGEIKFQFTTPSNARYVSITYAPSVVEKGTETMEKVINDPVVPKPPENVEPGTSEKNYGWFVVDGKTYYASYVTNEIINYNKTIGGKYYLWNDERGLELADGFVDDGIGIKCYENGVQVIGWHHADGSGPKVENGIFEQYSQSPEGLYYFLSTTGYMVTDSTYKLGGYVREFNDDHTVKALSGLQDYYGTYYYYVDGVKQTGWHTIDGVTYYFMASDSVYGQAAQRWMYIGNKVYYFYASTSATPYALKTSGSIGGISYTYHEDGYIVYNGFVNCEYANTAPDNTAANIQKKNATTRYYVNGEMQTEWQNINGNWYYFYKIGSANGSGYMCTESRTIGGVWYEFDKNGVCTNK